MAGDDSSNNNLFVRFKNNVDDHVKRGVETFTGPLSHGPASEHPRNETPASNEARASAEDVYDWAASSPYSPVNLQHLPQPRPRDSPKEWQDSFTFRDAFEDLLAERSGQPPSGIRALASSNMYWTYHYRHGLPVEDWVANMGQRGLWDAYFPLSSWDRRVLSVPIRDTIPKEKVFDVRYGISDPSRTTRWWTKDSPRGQSSWPTTERQNPWPRRSWVETSSSDDTEKAERAMRQTASKTGDADTEEDLYRGLDSPTEFAERMKAMQRSMFDSFDRVSGRKDGAADDSTKMEDDFNSVIKSASEMVKSIFSPYWGIFNNDDNNNNSNKYNNNHTNNDEWDGARTDNTSSAVTTTTNYPEHRSSRTENPVTEIIPTADGGRIVYSTRRIARDGGEHVTTTREHFDAEDNLVSRERATTTTSKRVWSTQLPVGDVSLSCSWQKKAKAERDDGYGDNDYYGGDGDPYEGDEAGAEAEDRKPSGWGAEGKRSGWFWTK